MIEVSKRNTPRAGLTNVQFDLATIDKLPLADASVDVVISNCVINLAADKQAVFREVARVLKPGGRLAVSDIALKRPLPDEIGSDLMAYVGCIAGAIRIEDYEKGLTEAGFAHVQVVDSGADLNAYAKVESGSGCCSPAVGSSTVPVAGASCATSNDGKTVHERLADLLRRYNVNDYAASVRVFAVKPN